MLLTISLERSVEIAVENREYHSLTSIMDCLLSEYLEGEINHSGVIFNEQFSKLPLKAKLFVKEHSVFADCFYVFPFIKGCQSSN